jgi:catechol 2,3-dioxygenase-like lactoylglutathione lyase family enzyme
MDQNKKNALSSAKLEHVGIVVKDMDKAISLLTLLGVQTLSTPPPKQREPREVTVRGKIIDNYWDRASNVHAYMGPIGLEIFICQDGETIYKEFLDRTGGGIHHFAYVVHDLDKAINEMLETGARVVSTARIVTNEKPHAYYMESDMAPGVLIELLGEGYHPFEFKY